MKGVSYMQKTHNNSLYHALFNSYMKTISILIFIIVIIFSIAIDTLIINYNIKTHVSTAEKAADNLSYDLQQNITLAYTLASNEDVLYNLRDFVSSSRIEQIDYDISLTEIFKNYTGYNSGISKIRIYFPDGTKNPIVGYKTVQYLSFFNSPEWLCYFQEGLSSISLKYTANSDYYVTFKEDPKKIAIIVPVNYQKENIAFLVMDIDKYSLFSYNFSKYPCTVIDNKGTVIYDTSNFSLEESFFKKISKSPVSSHDIIRKDNHSYLMYTTGITTHGFKVVQYIPYNSVTKYRPLIILIYFITVALFWFISRHFIKKKTLLFISPLSRLSNAMKQSNPVDTQESLPAEIYTLYESYNQLLNDNKKMLDRVSHSTRKQHKAEIKALLAQISPHFLYNTLNTVTWKATYAKQPEIATIISKLAKLCKISYSYNSDYVQLISEIQHTELYLQLQKEAFRKNFDYDIDLPDNFIGAYVPRFILQPIVENSIVHGFIQSSSDGNIRICIKSNKHLIITIEDNGTGIPPEVIVKLNNGNYKTEKYGIRNINHRIKMLCGDDYGIIFESNGYNYTKATITLPLIYEQPENEEV